VVSNQSLCCIQVSKKFWKCPPSSLSRVGVILYAILGHHKLYRTLRGAVLKNPYRSLVWKVKYIPVSTGLAPVLYLDSLFYLCMDHRRQNIAKTLTEDSITAICLC